MKLVAVVWVACALGVSACSTSSRPAESSKTLESGFNCLRIQGPGGFTPIFMGTTAPPLAPGSRVVRTNADWKKLWNSARRRPDTDPPVALPDGNIGLAITVHGGLQVHPHIREIVHGAGKVTILTQIEGRNFPEHDGQRFTVTDSDYLDTLIVFMPEISGKDITFEALPVLVWTPDSDEEVKASPPCAYRQ